MLAVLAVILTLNQLPFLFASPLLSSGLTTRDNVTHWAALLQLPDSERATLALLFTFSARKYALRSFHFFRDFFGSESFRTGHGYWMILGSPALKKANTERMIGPFHALGECISGAMERAPAPLGLLMAVLKFAFSSSLYVFLACLLVFGTSWGRTSLGLVSIILAKALLELWVDRGFGPHREANEPLIPLK